MSQPKITEEEVDGMKVICIGEPDFRKVTPAKLDLFLDWCMESLYRFYGEGSENGAEAKSHN